VAAPGGPANIAWSYPASLPGTEGLTGLIAFYDERVDVAVETILMIVLELVRSGHVSPKRF
jgi:hypothetical protein